MKNSLHRPLNQQGYTLIELSLVAAIIMFAGVFLLRLSGSIAGRGQYTTSDNRMRVIEAKIRQYYLAHEQLPAAAGAPGAPGAANNEIPVDITALDLEQKYRLDGWGHFFQYNTSDTNPGATTGLQDVNNGATPPVPTFAASITSSGPDQQTGTNDDIIKYLDLSMEADRIVQKKLKVLREKVATYDALFAGVNNNGASVQDQAIDEDPLLPADTGNTGCPPISGFVNDPATGLPTLDAIEMAMDSVIGGNAYGCGAAGTPLAFHLATYYRLPTVFPGGYDVDPWGNPFRWGCLGCGLTFDASYTITSTIPDTMDFHYHKFFSSGPDTTTVADDIIYNGK